MDTILTISGIFFLYDFLTDFSVKKFITSVMINPKPPQVNRQVPVLSKIETNRYVEIGIFFIIQVSYFALIYYWYCSNLPDCKKP
jgi:hypothetical protein